MYRFVPGFVSLYRRRFACCSCKCSTALAFVSCCSFFVSFVNCSIIIFVIAVFICSLMFPYLFSRSHLLLVFVSSSLYTLMYVLFSLRCSGIVLCLFPFLCRCHSYVQCFSVSLFGVSFFLSHYLHVVSLSLDSLSLGLICYPILSYCCVSLFLSISLSFFSLSLSLGLCPCFFVFVCFSLSLSLYLFSFFPVSLHVFLVSFLIFLISLCLLSSFILVQCSCSLTLNLFLSLVPQLFQLSSLPY